MMIRMINDILGDGPPQAVHAIHPSVSAPFTEWEWLVFSLVVVVTYLVARLVHWGSRWYLTRTGRDTESSFGRTSAEECYTPLSISIFLVGLALSLQEFGLITARSLLSNVVATVLAVIWTYAGIRIGRRWVAVATERESHTEVAPMAQNFWTVGVVVVGALAVSTIWDLQVTPFLASAGILGVMIGFAAQDGIRNLISGISLSFDDTYQPGDVVVLEDEIRGTVTDIGIRSTTVITPNNMMVTVPNAVLSESSVINQSAPQRHIRVDVPVAVAYDTDYEAVNRIVLEVCADAPMIQETPRPRVLFTEFGDSALVFEVQAYVAHPLTENRAIDQLNRRLSDRFAAAGVTIPFPQRELSFLEPTGDTSRPSESRDSEPTEPPSGLGPNG